MNCSSKLRLNESLSSWIMLKPMKLRLQGLSHLHQLISINRCILFRGSGEKEGLGYLHENKVTLTVLLCYAAEVVILLATSRTNFKLSRRDSLTPA